ncbi:MAG: trypsin-like peptidase domain-containing protein [Synechococcales cyanobacterium T60_A2020_003]|nr:trypsin-like peptidase domain-containing protein [Synechococcales cyanobacterium T60_A2020_003]
MQFQQLLWYAERMLNRLRVFPLLLCIMLTVGWQQPVWAQTPNPRSFVADAVAQVGPSVVRIDTERTITRTVPDTFLNDPFFRSFFGDEVFSQPFEEHLQGQGSGFIIDSSGIILTNAHVVSGADQVTVTLRDGRIFAGEVQGSDEVTDLAVVKVTPDEGVLPTATLGDSDQVQVGDWAIAVGNPLGLDNTVTLGIVSTLNRSSALVGIPDKRLDFIQTDAAINPGNSGGPLLNDRGEVIGINTAIRANANGIGFAIPINTAKEISTKLVQGERIVHPYMGVQIATLTPALAKQNNDDPNSTTVLPELNGVLVVGVVPNSPAAAAGLRRGDVITSVDGQSVTAADQLQSWVDQTSVGQTLRLTVHRGDRTQQLSVRTAELPTS